MKSNKLLSIIITTMKPSSDLENLFQSFEGLDLNLIEFIIINQHKKQIKDFFSTKINYIEINTKERLSCTASRNYGFSQANGKYLLFLDDHCLFHSTTEDFLSFLSLLQKNNDTIYILNKGYIKNKKFISFWKYPFPNKMTPLNIPFYIIEWSAVIPKNIFDMTGGFNNIGVGSESAAQCGEITIFSLHAYSLDANYDLVEKVKVSHPHSTNTSQIIENKTKDLGYSYGTGFSAGYSTINFLNLKYKLIIIPSYLLRQTYNILKQIIIYLFSKTFNDKYKLLSQYLTLIGFIHGLRLKKAPKLDFIDKFIERHII